MEVAGNRGRQNHLRRRKELRSLEAAMKAFRRGRWKFGLGAMVLAKMSVVSRVEVWENQSARLEANGREVEAK